MSQESDRELSHLYRAGAGEEPPPWLDRRIEASARRELPPSLARSFIDALPRWRWAGGAIAVVTLSVSLVTLMKDESPSVLDPGFSVAPSVEPRPSEQAQRSNAEAERADRGGGALHQEQPRTQSAGSAEPARQRVDDHADARAKQERDVLQTAPAAKIDSEVAKLAEPPAVAAAPAAAPPAVNRSEEIRQQSDARDASALGRMARKETPPARAAAPGVAEESPEAWVKRLSEWMQQGREQEVRAELQRFRQRHPEFPLPDDLRRLLAPVSPTRTPPATIHRDPATTSP